MTPREWLIIHRDPKVFLNNELVGMHRMAYHNRRQPYVAAGRYGAREAGVPKGLAHITVSITHVYGSKRPPDCDAAAPAVKGIIDGLVMFGVVKDDSPQYVSPVIYEMPMRAIRPNKVGLYIVIIEEPPTQQEAVYAANS